MILMVWITSLIAVFLLGLYLDQIKRRLLKLEKSYNQKQIEKRKTPEQRDAEKSTLIDLDDPEVVAKLEFDERFKQMNPQAYPDEDN